MKKIALYIPTMDLGGAEKVFMTLANEFCARGYKVDLLLTVKKGIFLKDLDKNINIIELSKKRVIFDCFKLKKYLFKNKPDAIVSGLTHSNLIAAFTSLFCGYGNKVFVTEHSNFTESMKDVIFYKRIILKFLISVLYPRLAGIISVSEGVKLDLIRNFPILEQKSTFIYNPFDVEYIIKRSKEDVLHPWLVKNRTYQTIISSGRLTPAKDFGNLLAAFSILKNMCNVRLIILGEGELRDELTLYIDQNGLSSIVDLYGFDENPFRFMSKADLFVLSSKREGLSNVLVESMICNVSIVSTDCPSGPSEILESGYWGDLVPVGNPQALADSMYKKLGIERVNLDYSIRVRDFSKKTIADQYLNYISESL